MKFTHDAIVIGGGAAGLTAAGGCALFGLNVALIEGHKMGGECLNNGCVPSKALITAAKRAAEARDPERFGITLAAPQVDYSGVHKHIHDAIAAIAPHDSEERFKEMGCEVIRDHARLVDKHTVEVGGRHISAPRIVLATGSKPFVPTIDGIDHVPYLTNENLFELTERPGHLVIIGGGVIGMEMAQAFRRLGSDVTVIEPDTPMGRDDEENVAVVVETMKAEGVRFVTGKAVSVTGSEGQVSVEVKGAETVHGTHLLVAVGRKANVDELGLDAAGIETGKDGIVVDDRRRTSVKNIYAIGDCRAGPRLTHVSGYEGSNVALEITLGVPAKVDYAALPWCTFTEPEVAQIGLTEKDAREKHGDAIRVVTETFHDNERALAEGKDKGRAKVIFKGKKVIGASIVGHHAGELLLPYSQLITGKASSFAMGSAIVAYPTRSEITKAAAFAAWEPTVFGKWPKKWARLVSNMRKRFA